MSGSGHKPKDARPAPHNPPSGGSSGRSASHDLEFRIVQLKLGPNDVLLVKLNDRVPNDVFVEVEAHVKRALSGLPVRTLIYDQSMDVAVLSIAEINARASSPSGEASA